MSLRIENFIARVGDFEAVIDRLEIPPGEVHVVMGRSGAGKSSLLQALAGFLPASGSVRLADRELQTLPPERRRIALVFQRSSLFPHLTVAENIGFGLAVQRVAEESRHQQVESWLNRIELPGFGVRLPHQLSEGQAQRVALARALAPGFPVLLLDEPFSALDAPTRRALYPVVRKLVRDSSVSALLVSHQSEDALALGDRISCLDKGKVTWTGTLSEAKQVECLKEYFE